jgi:hypothetical protein
MRQGSFHNGLTDGSLLSDHLTQSQVKVGVNYRFGGPAAAVAYSGRPISFTLPQSTAWLSRQG